MANEHVAIDTVPMPERRVRIVLPAKVAFNLPELTNALKNIAERLGCKACLSGADCLFTLERDFVVDPASLQVHGIETIGR